MSTECEWFRPGSPRVASSDPFLVRARTLAPALLGPLVSPRSARSFPARWIGAAPGVVLTVAVAGFESEHVHLQVMLHEGRLSGRWAEEMLVVDHDDLRGPETLVADVVPGREADAADLAVHWLAGQLARPVREERWVGWRGTIASRVVMADTSSVLWERGGRVIRRHGTPTQVLQVRPCADAAVVPGRRTTKGP